MKAENTQDSPVFPAWALARLPRALGVVAWEGEAHPLSARRIFPAGSALARRLPPCRGLHWSRAIHPIDRQRVAAHFENLSETNAGAHIDYRIITKSGNTLWIRHSAEYIINKAGAHIVRGLVSDISAEKQYQLESLGAAGHERLRIGQDLHDDICQILTAASCLLQVSEGRLRRPAPAEAERLHEINNRIIEAMNRARAICRGLVPPLMQDGRADIRAAIGMLAKNFEERFSVPIKTTFAGAHIPAHTPGQISLVYKIAQEAACNAVRHGQATRLSLRLAPLSATSKTMILAIRDNGSGFPRRRKPAEGMGMRSMAYRASLLGGEIEYRPAPAPSTGVLVRLTYAPSPDKQTSTPALQTLP